MSSVVYDIYMSPVKLESPGMTARHRYAVMCDYRGGKRVPLNPAAAAVPSHQHAAAGIVEANWPLRTAFEFPFQIPFSHSKSKKEFQLQILDGGLPGNSAANAANSKVCGELILNVGTYCKVLDQECVHRLVEVAFKMQGTPAILSLQLLMVPRGIPAESVEPASDLIARASGGSGIASASSSTGGGGGNRGGGTTGGSRARAAVTPPPQMLPGSRPNTRQVTLEQLSKLISIGAIDDSVWEAANGEPVEVDADVAEELLSNLTRLQVAEREAKAVGGGSAQPQNYNNNISNYESQTGPIGEAVFAIRTQRDPHEKIIASTMYTSLKKALDAGTAHAQVLAPSNNNIYSVDVSREFVARNANTTTSTVGATSNPEQLALMAELNTLEMHLAQLEHEQGRRDVTEDVCYVLERRGAIEEQLNELRGGEGGAATGQQQQNNASSPLLGAVMDDATRLELLQELVATERAIELLEWRRRARGQIRHALTNASQSPSEAFAALPRTLEPPMPLSFPKFPKKSAATSAPAAGGGGGALVDEFGFPIAAAASTAAKTATAAAGAAAANANALKGKASEQSAAMGGAAGVGAMLNSKASTAAGLAHQQGKAAAAASANAFDDFFGGGGSGTTAPTTTAASPAPAPPAAAAHRQQQHQQGTSSSSAPAGTALKTEDARLAAADDFFGAAVVGAGAVAGAAAMAARNAATSAASVASPLQQQLQQFATTAQPAAASGGGDDGSGAASASASATAYPTPPPPPAPSKWLQGKAMAWGAEASPPPATAPAAAGSGGGVEPSGAVSTAVSLNASSTSGVPPPAVNPSYAQQPQWSQQGASSSSPPPNQQQQQQQQQLQPAASRPTASPTTAAAPAAAPTSALSKADVVTCSYVGNLLTPPFARVSFDTLQHLILQKDVGNIQLAQATGAMEKRNGFIIRFAGGDAIGTRGISPVLHGLQFHIESDDFFNPTHIELNAVVLSITNGASESFGMKLVPSTTPAPATNLPTCVFTLDPPSVAELKPFCKGSPADERAIMVWPVKKGSELGGLTLVAVGAFTSNGGVPIRRTVPIRF